MIVPTTSTLFTLLALVALFPQTTMAAPSRRFAGFKRQTGDPQKANQLDPGQVMDGLKQDGSAGAEPGQVPSLTSENNFLNFCLTQNVPLTNGKQVAEGSCNPTIMGRIVAADKMLACKFQFPKNGDTSIEPNKAFKVQLKIDNMQTGFFANPNTNYNGAPQSVNDQGFLIGHSHVVIEQLPSLDSTEPLDPLGFKFFKGLNAPANGQGILETEVTDGLPAGFYRISSINTATTHQPALVAVAQHGTLDDGVYFEVKAAGAGGGNNGGNNGGGDNNNNGGGNGGNGGNNGGNDNNNGGGNNGNDGNGGNNGGNGGNNGGDGANNGGNNGGGNNGGDNGANGGNGGNAGGNNGGAAANAGNNNANGGNQGGSGNGGNQGGGGNGGGNQGGRSNGGGNRGNGRGGNGRGRARRSK